MHVPRNFEKLRLNNQNKMKKINNDFRIEQLLLESNHVIKCDSNQVYTVLHHISLNLMNESSFFFGEMIQFGCFFIFWKRLIMNLNPKGRNRKLRGLCYAIQTT